MQAGNVGCRPARTEEARLADPGDGDSIGLVASEQVEMRVVLADGEADMAALSAFEDQHGTGDRLHRLACGITTYVTALAKVTVGVLTTVLPPEPALAEPIFTTVLDPDAPPVPRFRVLETLLGVTPVSIP